MSYFYLKTFEIIKRIHKDGELTPLLIAMCAFNQGLQHLSDLSIQYLYKDHFHLSPAVMGALISYVYLPWFIKPIWGSLTDTYKLFGYRRKSYLILFSLMNFLLWQFMARYGMDNLVLSLTCLMAIQLCICFGNVIGEALIVEISAKLRHQREEQEGINDDNQRLQQKYIQIIHQSQKDASKYVSLFFGVRSVGYLISSYSSGALLLFLSIRQNYSIVFMICSIFPLMLCLTALIYREDNRNQEVRQSLFNTFGTIWEFFQNPLIAKPILLLFCFSMSPHSPAIFFYFYTNVLGFSSEFMGRLKFIYALATLLGIYIYNQFLRDVSFIKIFVITTIGSFLCYESLIILVTRKNVEWGINDKLFCLGDQVIMQLVAEFNSMPILVLATRMCPKSIEATMYALITSTLNFGSVIGIQFGSIFLIALGISQDDYSRLWLFILITSFFQLFPLPWVYVVKENKILEYRDKQSNNEQVIFIDK